MAVKDGLPATDLSRQNREYVKAVVDGTDIPDGLPATDLSRMNREWIKAVAEEAGGGGGGDITVEALSVTENGTYTADEGKAYSPVTVNVPPSGMLLSPLAYPVSIKNGKESGNISGFEYLKYNQTVIFDWTPTGAYIQPDSTNTASDYITDGTHFWFRASGFTNISYNGNPVTFIRDSNTVQVTIPEGYDGTIEFVLTS